MILQEHNTGESRTRRAWSRRKTVVLLFSIVFGLVHYLGIRNAILLSRDMLYGDGSAERLSVAPNYPPLRIPDKHITEKYQAVNRLASDFAQIYFGAEKGGSLYDTYDSQRNSDPFGRISRYAPLIEFMCAASICRLDYGPASVLHMLVQLLIFYLVLFVAFRELQIGGWILPALLLVNYCLFLTPVGLSWLERGQLSLYVAASYALAVAGLLKKKIPLIVLSALLAYVKWTSFPFLFVLLAVFVLSSRDKAGFRYSMFVAVLYLLIVVGLTIPRPDLGMLFLTTLMHQEFQDTAFGLSLALYMPRLALKALPFALLIIGYACAKFTRDGFSRLIPYAVGAATILLLYPTVAYDYSLPYLFGLLPPMIFWAARVEAGTRSARIVVLAGFVLFLLVGSSFSRWTHHTQDGILVLIYLVFSLTLMASPFILARYFLPQTSPIAPT